MKKIINVIFYLISFSSIAFCGDFVITTGGGQVNNAYVRIQGTSTGIASPMWYEIRYGGLSGAFIDVGQFPTNGNWFFIARHLKTGDNYVIVYGKDTGDNSIKSKSIWPDPMVETTNLIRGFPATG